MGLTSLLDLELAVPEPEDLASFWIRRGMTATAPGVLGTADRPSQLRIREGAYRHVSELRIGCDTDADLDAIGSRLDGLGVAFVRDDGRLRCGDPVLDHDVVVEVAGVPPLTPPADRVLNRPGVLARTNRRSSACLGAAPHAPRRVGHAVFGSPDVAASKTFYVDGLGFKVSDSIGDFAYFIRCSADHHNMLLAPAPIPVLNHYAVEMDDIDAIGLAGTAITAEREDSSVTGIGRHVIGANVFWYLLDPAGGMFELFADMDQITDDELWAEEQAKGDWDPFGVAAWNATGIKADFFAPADLDDLTRARDAARR
jgi:catechol 2,3-dioxygenase-like lactoylglutathione lyase family enzyme